LPFWAIFLQKLATFYCR